MAIIPLIAIAALAIASISLWRLSRLPKPLPAVDERTYATLREGDIVLVPGSDWLVADREGMGQGAAQAQLIGLRSGREKRWLLAGEAGPVALLDARPETADVDREVAARGGKKLDRATVDLLPGSAS